MTGTRTKPTQRIVTSRRTDPRKQLRTRFGEFVPHYLDVSRFRKNESTFERDLSHLKPLMVLWDTVYLHQITHEQIQSAQTLWFKAGLAKKTINNRCVLLSAILRMAYKQNLISQMPEIPKLRIDRKPPKWFTDEQLRYLLDSVRPFVKDFVLVLVHTGLRAGELRDLKWQDIDLVNRKIMIKVSKSHRFRVIPINDVLFEHLTALRQQAKPHQDYLFEGRTPGQPYLDFYHALKRELKRLGMSGYVHALRHTFASRLVQRGVSIYEVKELLGHASVQTTQIYSHLQNNHLLQAVNVLNIL